MSKKVIIIVDMLKGFLEEGYPLFCGEKVREIIPNIVFMLKKEDAELIYLCDSHKKDDLEFKMFPPHCIEGTKEAENIDELIPFSGIIIKKTRYSGFFRTNLDEILQQLEPEKIVVVGVCTDICVMYTVADLRNRDYNVEIHKNCVASFDEEAHKFALKHMEKVLGAKVI